MIQNKIRARAVLRWALATAVFMIAVSGPVFAGVTVTPSGKGYDIDIDEQTSASEFLDAISSATGVTVKGQPEDITINTNHLRGTSLERALRQLLPGAAFTVRFDEDDQPAAIIFLSPDDAGVGASDAPAQGQDDPGMTGGDGSAPTDGSDVLAPQ